MRPLASIAVIFWLCLAAPFAAADQLVAMPNGAMLRAPVTSYYALRFENVVRQSLDLSCGAAALATLMKFHYGIETSEKKIIDSILKGASEEQRGKIAKSGFSMLELKHEGERAGFAVGGFRIDEIEKLAKLRVPAITLIKVRGYRHFVVIKGVRNGVIHIADPAFGNRSKTLRQFAESWDHIILVFVNQRLDTTASAFTFGEAEMTPTREIVPLIDHVLRPIARGPAEF